MGNTNRTIKCLACDGEGHWHETSSANYDVRMDCFDCDGSGEVEWDDGEVAGWSGTAIDQLRDRDILSLTAEEHAAWTLWDRGVRDFRSSVDHNQGKNEDLLYALAAKYVAAISAVKVAA